jgi:diguanylate cyclase (GGDEF)-like protein
MANVCAPSVLFTRVTGVTGGEGPLAVLLRKGGLYPVFQPIANLRDGGVYAHEALIRGPVGSPLHTPDALLQAAAEEGLSQAFEMECIWCALKSWGEQRQSGRLFLNISASVLAAAFEEFGVARLLAHIRSLAVTPRMLMLEITEHERVPDMDQLLRIATVVRESGIGLVLDDFGDGRSSLRLWSQLKPEIVKIDKYFTRNISAHADQLKTLQALQQIAEIFGSELVAEGIETAEDLRVLRDLAINYGQGYLLGYPDRLPVASVQEHALQVLQEPHIVVFPAPSRGPTGGQLRDLSIMRAPTVTCATSNTELAAVFSEHPALHAVAMLEGDRPVGIINRAQFMVEFTKLYYREVWGRRDCSAHVNRQPRVIERDHSVDEILGILTSQDQRYLADGFIVTENGRYIGLGTGEHLVRSVTETRIEAARHANPLTFLPGNIPISQHIERLLAKRARFVACYADLNHFKPFNDHYGYWRGDEMIRLIAKVAMDQCDAQRDFLGHVGGDDFILLFQSGDWRDRCASIVETFNASARLMYDSNAQEAGGIEAEDRRGQMQFFSFTTVSIGAVVIESGKFVRAEEVANLAAHAKHAAKMAGQGLVELNSPVLAQSISR